MFAKEALNLIDNLTRSKLILESDETLKDTLMDLHNYAAMAIMCMEDDTEISMV